MPLWTLTLNYRFLLGISRILGVLIRGEGYEGDKEKEQGNAKEHVAVGYQVCLVFILLGNFPAVINPHQIGIVLVSNLYGHFFELVDNIWGTESVVCVISSFVATAAVH